MSTYPWITKHIMFTIYTPGWNCILWQWWWWEALSNWKLLIQWPFQN